MKITKDQEDILSQFKCERLSSNKQNKELIKNFICKNGQGLVDYLQGDAWEDDRNGKTACYLIKSPNGKPCLFFALKCGALFKPLDEDEIQKEYEDAKDFLRLLQDQTPENPNRDKIMIRLEQLRTKRNMSFEDAKRELTYDTKHQKNYRHIMLDLIKKDKIREGTRPIQRVRQTFPGIEMTHFCTDDNEKKIWNSFKFRFPMGEVLFWKYIAPIFIEIQKFVGCQYAFLFAADRTPDGTLTNYYNVELKFSKLQDVGTNKPYYDFCCEFMSQEVANLKKNMNAFFDGFNLDNQEEIV